MFGISIDDEPDAPVGKPSTRRAVAIHWSWTTEYTNEEIATALGVTADTVKRYLSEGPGQEVRDLMTDVEKEVRMVAVAELREQLRAAGSKARTAEKPVKIYANDDGDVIVRDATNDVGEVVDRYALPRDIQVLPDQEARYYARTEVRDILDQLTDLTGAGEPDQVEVGGEGIVIHTHSKDGDGD